MRISSKEKEKSSIPIKRDIQEIGMMTWLMVQESIAIRMVPYTKASFTGTRSMEMVRKFSQMDLLMLANMLMAKGVGREP